MKKILIPNYQPLISPPLYCFCSCRPPSTTDANPRLRLSLPPLPLISPPPLFIASTALPASDCNADLYLRCRSLLYIPSPPPIFPPPFCRCDCTAYLQI